MTKEINHFTFGMAVSGRDRVC